MLTHAQIDELSSVDIHKVEIDDLADSKEISINSDLPKDERLSEFLEKINNPYCYRYGDVKVKIEFTENITSLQDKLVSYFSKNR